MNEFFTDSGVVLPEGKGLPRAIPSIRDGVSSGRQGSCHVQGIAVDEENGFIYYSFTTRLVKTDFDGVTIGSVTGLCGHLGCIAFDPDSGKVYGSLEYKHDEIGRGLGVGEGVEDGFCIAVFDGAAITRENMSAEANGVMLAAFLPDVLSDYKGEGTDKKGGSAPHKYGCSGIDGLCFAPAPGSADGERFIYVAYGIYGDTDRDDNDHQVLLRYRTKAVQKAALPLLNGSIQKTAFAFPESKYFVYTGNTTYGVQNLEYYPEGEALLLAVYRGKKPAFPNYDIYAADLSLPAQTLPLTGLDETGEALTLLGSPAPESPVIKGWRFGFGQFGIHAKKDGGFYIAQPGSEDGEQYASIFTYRFDPENGFTK